MRVLHLVKTTDGATWAAQQAAVLGEEGIEVHVALPASRGRALGNWKLARAQVHVLNTDFPATRPWRIPGVLAALRRLVREVQPDLVHSHFVGTTQAMRYALGRRHSLPRIFQVPGPLHLEHRLPRLWELSTACPTDNWIASSRYVHGLYLKSGVPPERVFVSYYGTRVGDFDGRRRPGTRARFGLSDDSIVVGNINYMYRPRRYLGERTGLKGHENVIDAIALASRRVQGLVGLLGGGGWGRDRPYEERLRCFAESRCPGLIQMPGFLSQEDVSSLLPEFDLLVHAPRSENCGGIHEAMIAGTPVLVAPVGGLPELVIDGVTGRWAASGSPDDLADAIVDALCDRAETRRLAAEGALHARNLFDVERTGREVRDIYRAVLEGRLRGSRGNR